MVLKSLARVPSASETGTVLSFTAAQRRHSMTQAELRAAAVLQECAQTSHNNETRPQGSPALGYFLGNGWSAT